MARTPLKYRTHYRALRSTHKHMVYRCENPNSPKYHRYGGRGIVVSERWRKFENFYEDMVSSYKPGKTLDRINNDGNYESANCRWATHAQQANNKSTNKLIRYKGKELPIKEWAVLKGIKLSTLKQRYYVYKWAIEDCIERPTSRKEAQIG